MVIRQQTQSDQIDGLHVLTTATPVKALAVVGEPDFISSVMSALPNPKTVTKISIKYSTPHNEVDSAFDRFTNLLVIDIDGWSGRYIPELWISNKNLRTIELIDVNNLRIPKSVLNSGVVYIGVHDQRPTDIAELNYGGLSRHIVSLYYGVPLEVCNWHTYMRTHNNHNPPVKIDSQYVKAVCAILKPQE
ncbi:MAG: hypothetical protein Alpg2KO_17640 [Alphaproteobacteria bacterium]